MSQVELRGLDRLERCRLRFELGQVDDPFVDGPIVLEGSLTEVIATLRSVQMSLYHGEPGTQLALVSGSPVVVEKKKRGRRPSAPAGGETPQIHKAPKTGGEGKNVNWNKIIEALCAGDMDEYACVKKSTTAASTKSDLQRRFPGVDVTLTPGRDGVSTLTLSLGGYDPQTKRYAR